MQELASKIHTNRIYLVGYMTSGKTTFAKEFVKEMPNWRYIDIDEVIALQENSTIDNLIKTKGEAYFRNLETEILHSTKDLQYTIIATGGGLPCFNNNMNFIIKHGLSLFLNPPIRTLYERLQIPQNTITRPLWNMQPEEMRFNFLTKSLSNRIAIYTKADFEIDTSQSLQTWFHTLKNLFYNNNLQGEPPLLT